MERLRRSWRSWLMVAGWVGPKVMDVIIQYAQEKTGVKLDGGDDGAEKEPD